MKDFKNKTAFVTGAASGIGLALAKSLAGEGTNVVMADVNIEQLNQEAEGLRASGAAVETIQCDVSNEDDIRRASQATIDAFGKVHILANNAGVGLGGSPGEIPLQDWRWIVDVNLLSVVSGVEIFLPLMRSHGEGGYIVNTASMSGIIPSQMMLPYSTTKFAVFGYTEALHQALAPEGIGASVLCPAFVKTNIHNGSAGRPSAEQAEADATDPSYQTVKNLVENGIEPDVVAALTLRSMRANRLHIFTDPAMIPPIEARNQQILANYNACLEDLDLPANK